MTQEQKQFVQRTQIFTILNYLESQIAEVKGRYPELFNEYQKLRHEESVQLNSTTEA